MLKETFFLSLMCLPCLPRKRGKRREGLGYQATHKVSNVLALLLHALLLITITPQLQLVLVGQSGREVGLCPHIKPCLTEHYDTSTYLVCQQSFLLLTGIRGRNNRPVRPF